MNEYVLIVLSAIFINNFIVARFLGDSVRFWAFPSRLRPRPGWGWR